MTRLLLLLIGAAGCAPAASIFNLASNTGLNSLFTAAGTDFLNIDGNGLNLNIRGTVNLGGIDSVTLPTNSVLRIGSGKRSAIKVDYELVLTFSRGVSDFYFGTGSTTNQETFTLGLAPNAGGAIWSQNLLYPGSSYSSATGIGTDTFTATGPNGGNPARSVTLASATVFAAHYRMEKIGSSSATEDLFWGISSEGELPGGVVPEPSTYLMGGAGLLLLYLLGRWRSKRPPGD